MTRWLKRIGLILSFSALALLALHVDHAEAGHSSQAHHCCPCHFYSVTPNVAVSAHRPVTAVERALPLQLPAERTERRFGPGSPRGPPPA